MGIVIDNGLRFERVNTYDESGIFFGYKFSDGSVFDNNGFQRKAAVQKGYTLIEKYRLVILDRIKILRQGAGAAVAPNLSVDFSKKMVTTWTGPHSSKISRSIEGYLTHLRLMGNQC